MVSYEPIESHYFECACHSMDHTLRFTFDKEDHLIYAEAFLQDRHWYERIWLGLKYFFGYKTRHGQFGEWIMKDVDAERLRSMLDEFIEEYKNE